MTILALLFCVLSNDINQRTESSVSDQTLHGCHTHNACAFLYNNRLVVSPHSDLQERMTLQGVRIKSACFDIWSFPVAVIGHSNSCRLPETARLKAAWDIF